MPEELLTQPVVTESLEMPEGIPMPGTTDGLSEATDGLPEEYKPYSMLPWEEIPEETRDKVLAGMKKFHGGMTKQQQDVARLKAEMTEYKRQAGLLEQLTNEPWVKAAWEAHQRGQSAVPQPQVEEKPVKLDEHIDKEAASAIETLIERAIEKRMNPLALQVNNIGQEQANSRAKVDLDNVVNDAAQKGWPSPHDYLDKMSQLVATGRARSVEDAYRLAIFNDMPNVVETRTRQSLKDELNKKASSTVAPRIGPGTNGKTQMYSGKDAVIKAFNDAKLEHGL